ncbi:MULTISPECIES: hypothetical protein [unclassified Lentimonas]|uniref:hypothetical protein n=2 Tax=Lentimonas TaxID=417293 RepID=UPI001354B820|nr:MULTISPECIES: hypothetical protein [unclassified Lentimonas]CAA7172008.1 Unannotated [Lentimonas sp. CC21]CAA7182929.1 Unannotated [Lentimonas sp. CC8]
MKYRQNTLLHSQFPYSLIGSSAREFYSLYLIRLVRYLMLLAFIFYGATPPLRAAIHIYNFSSHPGLQANADFFGSITVNTAGGTEHSSNSGEYYVGHSAIEAWNFTITPSGGVGAYIGSSIGINSSATGNGGAFALYVTPNSITLVQGASLKLESDFNVAGNDVSVDWTYDTPIYYAGGVAAGGATWLNMDRAALDTAFPTNTDAGAMNWTIGTAIPEPATGLLVIVATLVPLGMRRRR